MAHKTGNEETEFKVAPPCINSRATTQTPPPPETPPHPQLTTSSSPSPLTSSSPSSSYPSPPPESSPLPRSASPRSPAVAKVADPGKEKRSLMMEEEAEVSLRMPMKRKVNRCSGCSKKVGLTGFTCRCGQLFCSDHRYSDRHDCTYDYKSAGRQAIARENPVVKAAKIVKI